MLRHFFILLLSTVIVSQLLTSCANIAPVEGGPKDTITPKVKSFYPKQNTVNFKGNEVEITFDEKIETSKLRDEILITPNYGNNLDIKAVNHKVKISFKDSLLPNTTYVIHFNKGIKDITESNIPLNLTYIFSTGPKIDSIEYTGTVKDIYTDKPIAKVLVGLYKYSDTLNIKKQKPDYYTYTTETGAFKLENIKPNKYKVFAITDDNKNLKFESAKEKIGFIITASLLTESQKNVSLSLVKQNDTEIIIQKVTNKGNATEVLLNKAIKNISLEKPSLTCTQLNNERKKLIIYNIPFENDSCVISLITEDSLDIKTLLKTTVYKEIKRNTEEKKNKKERDLEERKPQISVDFFPKNNEAVTEFKELKIIFDRPVSRNKDVKIYYKIDNQKTLEFNESKIKVHNKEVLLTLDTEPLDSIKITAAAKGSFMSCTGDSLQLLKHINRIFKEEEMASLEGTITTKETNYFIELVTEKGELIQKINKNSDNKFHFPKLKPGNYQLKAIIDSNSNDVWDCGNYATEKLPENIIFLPKVITLKQNWEVKEVNFPF